MNNIFVTTIILIVALWIITSLICVSTMLKHREKIYISVRFPKESDCDIKYTIENISIDSFTDISKKELVI